MKRHHTRTRRGCSGLGVLGAVAAVTFVSTPGTIAGQDAATTVVATPEGRYDAGWMHRLFLGDLNRELWPLEVEAPVLDLERFAGGLVPTERGGGLQTRSLRFQANDGLVYNFRSIDKDATRSLDPAIRESVAAEVLQDQIAALFPLSAMVVAPLLDAADLIHPDPELVVLPDSPALGEFRDEFAGLLGWIEVRPDERPDGSPGVAGSADIRNSGNFRDELEEDPMNRVDAELFLRARLMDLLVGDWDRHPDQWRWAAFEEGAVKRWEPIPRDRDWALSSIDGFLPWIAVQLWANYRGFSHEYGSVFGSVWNGRALDRELLSELTRTDFERVATDLQRRIDDGTIERAVGRLPASYREAIGRELEAALKNRRDGLLEVAIEFYGILAGWVDVWSTDVDEVALAEYAPDRSLRLRVFEASEYGDGSGESYFDRTFQPAETREVRVFMRGGDDRVHVRGTSSESIVLRVIGGGSDDLFTDETGGEGVHFYDDRGDNRFERVGSHTTVDESEYEEPEDTESATHQARPRDWGARWRTFPSLGASSDIGFAVGFFAVRESYHFRNFPYRSRIATRAGLNPVQFGVSGGVEYERKIARSRWFGTVAVEGSTREVGHYYGLGNGTTNGEDEDFFRSDRARARFGLGVERRVDRVTVSIGPFVEFSTPVESAGTLIEMEPEYGFSDFWLGGIEAALSLDSRDISNFPRRGGRVEVSARYVPRRFDVDEAFGAVRGRLSLNVPLGTPVLSLRVAADRVWGDAPYFERAKLGGAENLRGFQSDRFTGDAALAGSAQLRVPISRFSFMLPGTFGIHGLVDTGRVFTDDEPTAVAVESDEWHTAWGGGLWVALFNPAYTAAVSLAHSEERTGVYLTVGFGF